MKASKVAVHPRPLDSTEQHVLFWFAESPLGRCALDCPAGLEFAETATIRRILVKLGYLVLDCPPDETHRYLLTANGEALVKELTPEPRASRSNKGKSSVDRQR